MPFKLRKAPKREAYWVVDDTGKKYSKDPLPKERARDQQKALYAAEERKGKGLTMSRFRNRIEPQRVDYTPRGTFAEAYAAANDRTIEDPQDEEEPHPLIRTRPTKPKSTKKEDPQKLKKGKGITFSKPTIKKRPALETAQLAMVRKGVPTEIRELIGEFVSPRLALERQLEEEQRKFAKEDVSKYKKVFGKGLPPPKRSYETEDDYQKRLLRIQQSEEKFREKGITPEMREGAIVASNRARQLRQMRDVLGQQASKEAFERDPRTIAQREAIAQKEREDVIFNPLLRGAIGLAKNIGKLPGVSSLVGKVGSVVGETLGSQMDVEEQQKIEREQRRAEMMEATKEYRSDIDKQLTEGLEKMGAKDISQVDFSELDKQIAEQERIARTGKGVMNRPRFGGRSYF